MSDEPYVKGGSFLLGEVDPQTVFTPEDFSDEHRMVMDTAREFTDKEVMPVREKINELDYDVIKGLLKEAGGLGLLGVEISEKHGGLDMGKVAAVVIAEAIGKAGSFPVTLGAHSGIGTLPIYYFGNDAQKDKYLPDLVKGEKVAAFCLTEPNAGTDALSAKTKAVLSKDKKHYVINGTKQWITNGGIADVFVVLARTEDDKLTAFIAERGFGGITSGEEEKKMGIKGSSTTVINLDDVKVPAENMLGSQGEGVKIFLSILNLGRAKLAAGCMGACKDAITQTIQYTTQREQFGKPLNQFGLIQEKLANMAVRTCVSESAIYRAAGLLQEFHDSIDKSADDAQDQLKKSIAEYAVECSILKVFVSEALDYVADEGVQCFGGYGFSCEYPMEGIYRDSRINRIFEGTNEINRLLIPGMLMRRSMKGKLPLAAAAQATLKEMSELPSLSEETGEMLEREKKLVVTTKKAALLASGAGMQKFGKALQDEQELLRMVGDSIMDTFVLESAVLRALKIAANAGEEAAQPYVDVATVFAAQAAAAIDARMKECAAAVADGDELRILLMAFRRFCKYVPGNVKETRRKIAGKMIEKGEYVI